ncbi:MAG: TlyA family RNA methyltransferase, partial [Acidimicrobiales bacterium]
GIGGAVAFAVGDLSFISLRAVLEPILAVCHERADLVLLVKPQFESRRQEAAKGQGIITDPTVWRRVLTEVAEAGDSAGAGLQHATVSPIRGRGGNIEFLYHFVAGAAAHPPDLDALVDLADETHARSSGPLT